MAWSRNPLFREFDREQRRVAREAFRQTEAYKLVRDVKDAINTPRTVVSSAARFGDMLNRYSRHGFSAGFIRQSSGMPFKDMVREVVKYQAGGGESARLITELLGALGPMGRLLKALLAPGTKTRGTGVESEVDAAVRFLQAFAPEKLSPEARKLTTGGVADSIEAAIARLEAEGYQVIAPPVQRPATIEEDDPVTSSEQTFYPGGVPKSTATGDPRKVVDIEVEGTGRRFPANHPIVTKEMVRAASSNVWSFGYDVDASTLYVRYRSGPQFGNAAGSLYAYSNVQPEKFLAMYDAPSKGIWLWDNVRIRGTWSGHRHDYRLVAIRNDYVPRKATYAGAGQELFIPRTVRVQRVGTGKVRTLRSSLPEQFAPLIVPTGEPNRGGPNRGTPNRGR